MPLRPIGVVFLVVASLCAQQPSAKPSNSAKHQTVFSSPDRWAEPPQSPVAQPIPIPPRVLELIKEDQLFQMIVEHLGYKGLPAEQTDKQDWLVASEIDLGCTRGVLVVGQGPLRGTARMSPFWIFAADKAGEYQPPLAVAADRIQVRGHWWKACSEIRTGVRMPDTNVRVTRFRLKAARFVRHDSWTEPREGVILSADEIRKPPPDLSYREPKYCPGSNSRPDPMDSDPRCRP